MQDGSTIFRTYQEKKVGFTMYEFRTYLDAYTAIHRLNDKINYLQKERENIRDLVNLSRNNGGPLKEPSRPSQVLDIWEYH